MWNDPWNSKVYFQVEIKIIAMKTLYPFNMGAFICRAMRKHVLCHMRTTRGASAQSDQRLCGSLLG